MDSIKFGELTNDFETFGPPNWGTDGPNLAASITLTDNVPAYASNPTPPLGEADDVSVDSVEITSSVSIPQRDSIWEITQPINLPNIVPSCTPISVAVTRKPFHRKHIDNEEFVPEKEHCSQCTPIHKKKGNSRIRGHNLDPDIRYRVGQLMIGYKNKFPRKSKKEIAHLISKRIAQEFPYVFYSILFDNVENRKLTLILKECYIIESRINGIISLMISSLIFNVLLLLVFHLFSSLFSPLITLFVI